MLRDLVPSTSLLDDPFVLFSVGCSGHHHSSGESLCPRAALQHGLLEHRTLLRTPTLPGTQAGPALCQWA